MAFERKQIYLTTSLSIFLLITVLVMTAYLAQDRLNRECIQYGYDGARIEFRPEYTEYCVKDYQGSQYLMNIESIRTNPFGGK